MNPDPIGQVPRLSAGRRRRYMACRRNRRSGWDDVHPPRGMPGRAVVAPNRRCSSDPGAVIPLGKLVMILELHRQGVSAIARQLDIDQKDRTGSHRRRLGAADLQGAAAAAPSHRNRSRPTYPLRSGRISTLASQFETRRLRSSARCPAVRHTARPKYSTPVPIWTIPNRTRSTGLRAAGRGRQFCASRDLEIDAPQVSASYRGVTQRRVSNWRQPEPEPFPDRQASQRGMRLFLSRRLVLCAP